MSLQFFTRHLMRVQNVTNSFSDQVPATETWIARTINIAYGGGLLTEVRFFVAGLLVIDDTLFTQPEGPSFTSLLGYFALDPGEQMHVTSSGQDQGIDVYVTGYKLTLV